MVKIFSIILLILCSNWANHKPYKKKNPVDPCRVYGRIYIDETRAFADCAVYMAEDEVSAQLPVFLESNSLFADKSGKWHLVNSRGLADFIVYVEKNKTQADFTVYFTDVESFAGCK